MDICAVGVPTYHTRVEAWECDHNEHWNVRHYMRCFRQAGFVVADMASAAPLAGSAVTQHTRFHRELLQTAPVEVRSAVLSDGDLAGAIVHVLSSDGRLSATALEQPGHGADALPRVRADEVALALPRGIDGQPHEALAPTIPEGTKVMEHGLVQPGELDHAGSLAFELLMGRMAAASSDLLTRLGFTPEYGRTHGLSRMGVETKVTRFGAIPAGTRLCSVVRIASVGRKNVVLRHGFFRPGGTEIVAADQSLVVTDMKTRRATEVPAFLRAAAAA